MDHLYRVVEISTGRDFRVWLYFFLILKPEQISLAFLKLLQNTNLLQPEFISINKNLMAYCYFLIRQFVKTQTCQNYKMFTHLTKAVIFIFKNLTQRVGKNQTSNIYWIIK